MDINNTTEHSWQDELLEFIEDDFVELGDVLEFVELIYFTANHFRTWGRS